MSIFEFTNYLEFIRFRISKQLFDPNGRKKSNLTRVARTLGYTSPALLSLVLNGKRLPSDEFCESAIRSWRLSIKEREYFRLLLTLEREQRKGQDTSATLEQIKRLAGKSASAYVLRKESELAIIREWYNAVIQQMVQIPFFQEDPAWISAMLRRKITPSMARRSLERLTEVGLVSRDPDTGRLQPAPEVAETGHDIPSEAIRAHQRGMIQRSLEALEDRPVEQRHFNAMTFNMDMKHLPELKKRILEFMRSVSSDFSSPTGSSVCQLNLQFFEHTVSQSSNLRRDSHEIH